MQATLEAALAAHRFGLGEPDLALVGPEPRAWLLGQIGPAEPQQGAALASSLEGLRIKPEVLRRGSKEGVGVADAPELERNAVLRADMHPAKGKGQGKKASKPTRPGQVFDAETAREMQQDIMAEDLYARLAVASNSRRPFAERLVLFWANHFTVSQANSKARALVGAFEREVIRPNIAARFDVLLRASTLHPGMLRYLDNQRSIGPHSAAALLASSKPDRPKAKRSVGLNENLAREVLELHTLGAESSRHPASPAEGYVQADVTELARILSGWTTPDLPNASTAMVFEPERHEPGSKQVLGKTYPQGPQALDMVLRDLALHPATARHLSTKLARHFVADEPPAALIDRLTARYLKTGGDLAALSRELVEAPEAWQPGLQKLKRPDEFAISSARLLGLKESWLRHQRDGGISSMGQRLQWAPSPAGWSDRGEDWLGPDAVWKRIEWSQALAQRFGAQVDARALARNSLGPLLSEQTAQQIERAADGHQALTLLLMSPEFQRR